MSLPHDHDVGSEKIMERMPAEENFRTVATLMKQMDDPSRLRIFWILCHVEECVIDIAAMAGAFIGAAYKRVPVVIDGFISIVAALCACRLCPASVNYMVTSHASYEIGYRTAAEALGLRPLFDLGMRLGEGSGCPIAMMILDAACAVINDMATFEEAEIDDSYLDEIRDTDAFSVNGENR